jgi:hypothetical protein
MKWPRRTARNVSLSVLTLTLAASIAAAQSQVVDLAIQDGRLRPEQRVIRVQRGDAVTLRCTSDRALTLHLHGYDIERRVDPGTTATMSFVARAAGRFAIEIHGGPGGRATTLGYLEVRPR